MQMRIRRWCTSNHSNNCIVGHCDGERSTLAGSLASFLDKLYLLTLQGGNPAARRVIKSENSSSSSTTLTPTATPPSRTKNPATQGVTYGYPSLAPECAGESGLERGAVVQLCRTFLLVVITRPWTFACAVT